MENRKRRVQFIGMKATRSLSRFIEKQIEKWIQSQPIQSFTNMPNYKVTIEREDHYKHYQCDIDIRIGGKHWHGFESSKNLHDAITHALKHISSRPLDTKNTQSIIQETHQVA